MNEPPLVVDLDGSLLRAGAVAEAGIIFFRDHPQRLPDMLWWLCRGGNTFRRMLAREAGFDASAVPCDAAVLELIAAERGRGREIVMLSKGPREFADAVARQLALFDHVVAEGEGGVPATPVAVHPPAGPASAPPAGVDVLRNWLRAMRVHQWLKNLLIFVPLLAAHRYAEPRLLADALLAFIAFGLCASSVYILNDLLDLRDDRHHPRKRSRPFASGQITVASGLLASPLLLLVAFALALWRLPPVFTGVLAVYYLLTLAYSLTIKRRMVFDVITLAGLYTLRIVAGAFGLSIPLSFWLLALSMFMFLSLALVKRYAELFQARASGSEDKAPGRGYYPSDLQMISSLGAASGYMAVMVLALYINDARTGLLYEHVEVIWLVCPLLLTWISRVWMLTHRGHMNDDPVIFAVRDRISLALGALAAVVFWFAA